MARFPVRFTLIALFGVAESGLSVFWIHNIQNDPSSRFQSLISFLLLNSCWTVLFASLFVYGIISSVAIREHETIGSSCIPLTITATLWGVAAGRFHMVRASSNCDPAVFLCYETLALEVTAWMEMGLCIVTLLDGCCWLRRSLLRPYRGSW